MNDGDQTSPGAVTKVALLTACFSAAFLCLAFAAKLRLVDRVKYGEDIPLWVIGIVVNFFAGIAASRVKGSMKEWLTAHPTILRFWTACGALGTLLFGAGLAGVSIFLWLEKDRPHRGEGVIALMMAAVGLVLVGWGVIQAASLLGSTKGVLDEEPPL